MHHLIRFEETPQTRRCVMALLVLPTVLAGCTSPRWETATYDRFPFNWGRAERGLGLIRVVALTPGAGELSEAIGVELAKRGFVVVPAASTVAMAVSVDFDAVSVRRSLRSPAETAKLRHALYARGVDAFLVVRAHDFSPRPYLGRLFWQQAEVELHGTTDEYAASRGAFAGTAFANLRDDRPSTASEAARDIVTRLAIGPGAI